MPFAESGRYRSCHSRVHPSADNKIRKASVICKPFGTESKGVNTIELERAVHNLIVLISAESQDDVPNDNDDVENEHSENERTEDEDAENEQ